MNSSNDRYLGVLLEEIRDQNKAVLEAVGDMQVKVAKLDDIESSVQQLTQEMKIIEAAVTDTSHHVSDHERRLIRLESVRS